MFFQYVALRIASCGFYLFIFPFVSVSYSKYGERNKMKEEIQYFVCAHTTHHRCCIGELLDIFCRLFVDCSSRSAVKVTITCVSFECDACISSKQTQTHTTPNLWSTKTF